MTPSEWLSRNLSDLIVAVAQAGAGLAGAESQFVPAQLAAEIQKDLQ